MTQNELDIVFANIAEDLKEDIEVIQNQVRTSLEKSLNIKIIPMDMSWGKIVNQ
jgi:hypothetical protein